MANDANAGREKRRPAGLGPDAIGYVDNHLLVVEKPAGVLSQGDSTGDVDLLTMAKAYVKARYQKPGAVFLGLVHRLDRPVSGVMVFARTSKAASRLAGQFKTRTVDKRYVALVEGRVVGEGRLIDHLWKDHRTVRIVKPTHPKGQQAELTWRSVGYGDGMSLLDVRPLSGRPHQIRVQLAHMGHPIVGDMKYGARQAFDGRNLALHSYHLAFDHPTLGERCAFEATPPRAWPDWARELVASRLLDQAGGRVNPTSRDAGPGPGSTHT